MIILDQTIGFRILWHKRNVGEELKFDRKIKESELNYYTNRTRCIKKEIAEICKFAKAKTVTYNDGTSFELYVDLLVLL